MTVLYVDDDSDDREIFGGAIHAVDPGVTYKEFEAGENLIDFLRSEKIQPDYIFVDINMPKMNGYECVQEITSVFGIDYSRIVMYSTFFNKHDIEKFRQFGVKMLQKADSFDKLIKNIRELLAAGRSVAANGSEG